jgi:excisionase family DNA binding protein
MFEQHLGRSVTIDQAAALLHVSRRTIYNRIREGKLQTIRTIGGSQRVLLSSLDENRRPVWSAVSAEPAGAPDAQPVPFAIVKAGTDSGTRES